MDKQKLYEEISQLDYSSKIELIEALAKMLKPLSDQMDKEQKEVRKKSYPSLIELGGLGYETWKDADVKAYLKEERESWD